VTEGALLIFLQALVKGLPARLKIEPTTLDLGYQPLLSQILVACINGPKSYKNYTNYLRGNILTKDILNKY